LGRPVDDAHLAVDAVSEEAQAARIVSRLIVRAFGRGPTGNDGSVPVYHGGRVDLGLIQSLGPALGTLLGHLAAADADIRGIHDIPFLHLLSDVRARALEQSAAAVRLARHALAAAKLLPSFFGAEGPRSYLLTLTDSSAPVTGGMKVEAFGILTVTDGRISLSDTRPIDSAMGSFASRFEILASQREGFSLVARGWTDLLQATGRRVDGVIALDPVAIATLLQGQTSIRLPGHPDGVEAAIVPAIMRNDVGRFPRPRRHALAVHLLKQAVDVFRNPPDVLQMIKHVSGAAADLHIQMWMTTPSQQQLIEQLGWGGQ